MNLHLKLGLIAFLIAFGVVLIHGAVNIYFDPPIDVSSVGYWAFWLLVKAVLAIVMGFGLIVSVLVSGGSWLIANISKTWVKIGLLVLAITVGGSTYLLEYPFKKVPTARNDEYSQGRVHCCAPHR